MSQGTVVVGIETSGHEGSVALLLEDKLLGAEVLGDGTARGVSLHPALERLLARASLPPSGIGLVVVGTGPGSFTGMRVGVAAARSLAFAAGCPVVGVPSYDALAAAAPPDAPAAACVRDARRGDVYFALYGPPGPGGAREARVPPCRRGTAEAAASLPPDCVVLGEFAPELAAMAGTPGVRAFLPEGSPPAAASLGLLGRALLLRDGPPDPATVVPLYLQPPLALRRGEGVRGG